MTRLRGAIAALAVLAGCGLAPVASAQSYRVVWMIAPEEAAPVTWVTPYTSIASARLVPGRMLVIGADVKGADGKTILPAGTELISPASTAILGCTMSPSGLHMLSPRFFCLLDSDRDGRFDQLFNANTPIKVLFTGLGRIPKKLTPIDPVPFERRDPMTATFKPRIYVQYGWFASFVGELVFQICLRENERGPACMTEDFIVKSKTLPGEFTALGARFSVEAKEENRVQVRMLSGFPAQPFILNYE